MSTDYMRLREEGELVRRRQEEQRLEEERARREQEEQARQQREAQAQQAREQVERERQEQERQEKSRLTIEDAARREAELRKQADDAAKLARGEGDIAREITKAGPVVAEEYRVRAPELQEAAKRYEFEADTLRNYQDTLRQIEQAEKLPSAQVDTDRLSKAREELESSVPAILAITDKKLSNFITVNKDGSYSVDVQGALKSGVDKQKIYDAGISEAQVSSIEKAIKEGVKIPFVTQEQAELAEKLDIAVSTLEENRFKRLNTQLPDKNWIAKSELTTIKKENPDVHKILTKQGFEEAIKYIQEYNADIEKQIEAYNKYLKNIGIVNAYASKENPEQIELVRLFQSGNEVAIRAAREVFDDETIKETENYIKELKYINVTPEVRLLADKGVLLAQRLLDYEVANNKSLVRFEGKSIPKDIVKELQDELTKKGYQSELKEYMQALGKYNDEIREIKLVETKEFLKTLPDAFIPFKATIQNWDKMTPLEQGAALAGDIGITILYVIGAGQLLGVIKSTALPASALAKAQKTAKIAGKASKDLSKATKALLPPPGKTGILTRDLAPKNLARIKFEYNKLINNANRAIEASVKADKVFLDQLGMLKKANPADLRYLEKLSKMDGLKKAILDANKAARNLDKAWAKIPQKLDLNLPPVAEMKPGRYKLLRGQLAQDQGKSGYYFRDFLPDDLYMRYQDLTKAQAAYEKAMQNLQNTVKVRYTQPPPPDMIDGLKIVKPKPPTGKPGQDVLDDVQKIIDEYNARIKTPSGKSKVQTIERTRVKVVDPVELKPEYKPPEVAKSAGVATKVPKTAKATPAIGVTESWRFDKKTTKESAPLPAEKAGSMTPEQLARYYGVEDLVGVTSKRINETGIKMADLLYPNLSPSQKQAEYIKAFEQEKEGLKAATDINIKDVTKSIDDVKAELESSLQPELQPEVKTQVETKVKTDLTERVKSPRPKEPKPRFQLPSGKQDKQTRELIKNSGGAVAWRMGKVAGKDRWDVIVNPYESNEHHYMVLGRAPEGATIVKKGEGSAYGTTQVIKGEGPERKVTVDSGIVDIHIEPVGRKRVKMRVLPDPKQQTTGDITIGGGTGGRISGNSPAITERSGGITGRQGRISGRTPRISRRTPKIR